MNIDIVNMDKLVSLNKLPQISSALVLDKSGEPYPDGLLSYEIFGRNGTSQRKFQCAYIDLKKNFFHPVIYRTLTESFRFIGQIINGSKKARVSPLGAIEIIDPSEETDNSETGLDFFYNNWNKIKWERHADSKVKIKKIKFIEKFDRDEIFLRKWLVIPPFYRDVNNISAMSKSGIISIDELTSMYARLIRLTNIIDQEDIFFSGSVNTARVQSTLYELYEFLTQQLAKKNGLIHKKLLGKTVDYPARIVISAAPIDSETYDKQQIPFGYIGLPLHIAIGVFYPFVMHELKTRILSIFHDNSLVVMSKGEKYMTVDNETLKFFNEDYMNKLIKLYSRSVNDRFLEINVSNSEGESKPLILYGRDQLRNLKNPEECELLKRTTLVDLLFTVTQAAIRDKYVLVTRYPLETFNNIFPAKVKILCTEDTQPVIIGGKVTDYPIIKTPDATRWIESTRLNNLYHPALGSDFDGDMISVKGLFSVEANKEAEKIMTNGLNFFDPAGEPVRTIGKELTQSFFNFTRQY